MDGGSSGAERTRSTAANVSTRVWHAFFTRYGTRPAGRRILTTDLDRYAANRDDLWQIY
jgi:hypothetical protein